MRKFLFTLATICMYAAMLFAGFGLSALCLSFALPAISANIGFIMVSLSIAIFTIGMVGGIAHDHIYTK